MIQNLVWATGYNVVAIPLAAGVLYTSGFVLGPAVGAIFMSLSTIIVHLRQILAIPDHRSGIITYNFFSNSKVKIYKYKPEIVLV